MFQKLIVSRLSFINLDLPPEDFKKEKDATRYMQNKIIDRISRNALNVFYDILVISKIDFTGLFKNNNYGFHDYIS